MLWSFLNISNISESLSSFVSVSVGFSLHILVMLIKCLLIMSAIVASPDILIVFTKHHFVTIQTFVKKKGFIVFQNFSLSLILIMSSFQKFSEEDLHRNPFIFYSYSNLS